ncbi:unnamed protein product [Merluccius merluccius]
MLAPRVAVGMRRGVSSLGSLVRHASGSAPLPCCYRRDVVVPPPGRTSFLPPGRASFFPLTVHARRHASGGGGGNAYSGLYGSVADSSLVHLTEQLLVSTQGATGLPWWASIMCTTLALRTVVTLPLGAYQMVVIGKVEALQSEIAELAKRLRYEVSVRAQERGWQERHCRYQFKKNLRRIVSELYVRDNCHPFKASLLVWVQLPMWICLSLALRNLSMASSPAGSVLQTELTTGGALWFSDLTLPDHTWVLPISLGLINLLIIEMFAAQRLQVSSLQKYMTHFLRGVSVLMVPIAATVPSCMALYWLSSSLVGLGHNLLLRSPRFQSACRIPRLRSSSQTPYRDLAAALRAKYLP